MIIFDEHAVGEIQAMIESAAAAHGVLVENAQAGSSLASIENARPGSGDGVDEFPRQSCNAAHALKKVQYHAFA